MAYRIEQNSVTEKDEVIIDGFQAGIADSPYEGIASLKNLNIKYYPGIVYPNYKLQAATINSGVWFAGTHSTNVSGNTGWFFTAPTSTTIASQFTAWAQSPAGIVYLIDTSGNILKQTGVGASTFANLTGNPVGGTGQGIAFWRNYLLVFRDNSIDCCGDGTGDAGITASNWITTGMFPIINTASVSLTGTPAAAATSATLSSAWTLSTGTYQATVALTGGPPNSQKIYVSLVNGATTISWLVPLWLAASGATLTNVTAVATGFQHPAFISSNDNWLYYGNGSFLGALSVPAEQTFNPLIKASFAVNYSALGLPDSESISWISELRTNLLVGGIRKIYPWDRVSTSWQTPIPVTEPIRKIVNIMNNIYIFAGNKGNIYFSNGYAISLKKKIPDSFFNAIDPQISIGGYMQHRNKLFFQVYAQDSKTNIPICAGVMSYDITTEAINFDNENSTGFVPSATGSGVGNVLVDISDTSTSLFDNYLSSWYNSGVGGLDYNNTTLPSNNEPQIETDLIPVGTFTEPKTYTSIEFKLDKPLASGDSITVYARNSLGDTYTLVGTTNTAILSDFYNPLTFQKNQWLQLKVTMSCGTNSSFIRLREIRIR